MLGPLRQHQNRPARQHRLQDVVTDRRAPRLIRGDWGENLLKIVPWIAGSNLQRLKARRVDHYLMGKGSRSSLLAGVDTMPHGAALHENDRVLSVLSRQSGGQPERVSGLRPPSNRLEAARRQVVTFIHDQLSVMGHFIADRPIPAPALDQRHVQFAV